jgi:hypothetical protein
MVLADSQMVYFFEVEKGFWPVPFLIGQLPGGHRKGAGNLEWQDDGHRLL